MFYDDDFKEKLRSSISIVDVVSYAGLQLHPTGQGYITQCPFHDDNIPSLSVNPEKNYFHCFSCGAGSRYHSTVQQSDIFSFVMGFFNLNMYDAVKWLSETFNIYPDNTGDNREAALKAQMKDWWRSVTLSSNKRFQKNLLNNPKSYYYLTARGINDLEIANWGIGYGDSEQVEFKHTAGKVTFPIKDYYGNIVSFVARVPLSKEDLFLLNEEEKANGKRVTPKYEHRWRLKPDDVSQNYYDNHPYKTFERKHYLYGIYEAKESIRRFGKAIVVEGFTDVISLHKHSITHAVSTMGLRLTDEHLSLLKRAGAHTITLMRDGDLAGIQAAERDAKLLKENGFKVDICPLPNGHDPDTLANTFSIATDDFARFIASNTRSIPQWKVEYIYKKDLEDIMLYNTKIHALKVNQIDSVINALKEEEDLVERDLLTHQYAQLFNVSPNTLKEYMEKEITL